MQADDSLCLHKNFKVQKNQLLEIARFMTILLASREPDIVLAVGDWNIAEGSVMQEQFLMPIFNITNNQRLKTGDGQSSSSQFVRQSHE